MSLIIFILILAALIVVHEFGHFIAAKIAGIRVEEFAIGFPPRLISKKIGETRYALNLLLLGGYVKVFGEQGEETSARSFSGKHRGIQALVVVAGIAMNFLAAWLLIASVYMMGMPTVAGGDEQVANPHPTVVALLSGSPAQKAGLQENDTVEKVQTGTTAVEPTSAQEVSDFIRDHQDESVVITVQRGKEEKTVLAHPEAGILADEPERKAIGAQFADVGIVQLSPVAAFTTGARLTYEESVFAIQGLGGFFRDLLLGHPDFSAISGPVGIAKAGSTAVAEGLTTLLWFAAVISLNLAIINVLPIPGLDGGRLLVIAIEGVRGKALSQKLQWRFSVFGFALLIALMVVVTYHDISKLI